MSMIEPVSSFVRNASLFTSPTVFLFPPVGSTPYSAVHPYSAKGAVLNESEWVRIAAARLRVQWPLVPEEQLAETATELWQQGCWRDQPPVAAVVEWLRLGVLREQ